MKRAIPSLAAGALSLAGCANVSDDAGGGTNGGGGTGGVDGLDASLRAFCMKAVECDPASFEYESCVQLGAAFDDALSQECRDIVQSYFLCVARGTCQEFFVEACYNDDVYSCISPLIAIP